MGEFLDQVGLTPLAELAARQLLQGVLLHFFAFTLIAARLSGLMTTAPGFSNINVPINVRVLLVVTMSLLLSPTLQHSAGRTFERLDVNRDGWLERAEIPRTLETCFDDLLERNGRSREDALRISEFRVQVEFPASVLDYLWVAAGEFALGLVLGIGTTTVLSGLQLAGQLIDQQTGVGLGEVFNPDLETSSSVSGEMLYVFGTTVFLLFGGHLLLVRALFDTFQTLPLGHAFVSQPAIDLLIKLVHQSLSLSLQVSAPLMATMSVVALAMGFLGHTVPQINILVFGFPIRVMVGLLVLALAMAGIGEAIADTVPAAIEQLRSALSG